MKRNAQAVWQGGLKEGHGALTTDSGVLSDAAYSFGTRFEEKKGTNPEELIAAAHAGCFSMALSGQLVAAGVSPKMIRTEAHVSLEQEAGIWSVTSVHLDVAASVIGISAAQFEKIANDAKVSCPISRLLNAKITISAKLEESLAAA
jgi:lipoyl-dependent peroxiredoxin